MDQALSRRGPISAACSAFDIKDGKFLWQHTNEKHPAGRVYDWPLQGVCSAAYAEGDRLWFVTNMGEVRCVDAEGFYDGENDGPYVDEQKVIDAQIASASADSGRSSSCKRAES